MVEGPRSLVERGAQLCGDVATRLHQEGSYTTAESAVDVAEPVSEPVPMRKQKNDKPRVIRRLCGGRVGGGGYGGERAFYKARSRVARNAGRADRRGSVLGL